MPNDPDFDVHKVHHERWWWFKWTWHFDWPWNKKGKIKKGHGLYFPWWFFPVAIVIYPFAWIADKFRKEKRR